MFVRESLHIRTFGASLLALVSLITIPQLPAQESLIASPPAETHSIVQASAEATPTHPSPYSSDVVSYWYCSNYHTPFVLDASTGKAANIARNSVEYTHSGRVGCN